MVDRPTGSNFTGLYKFGQEQPSAASRQPSTWNWCW